MRPVRYPGQVIELPPRLCASVDYYASAWNYGSYRQAWEMKFDKRDKDTHRFAIADTRGELTLTVPIAKPASGSCRWSDIMISTHGAWWDVHRVALESAYGRTPFFEFYIDRFLPMLTVGVEERYPLLSSLALAWDEQTRDILGITQAAGEVTERKSPESYAPLPYYQVRGDKLGFIPHLSILDLIFNIGPEAPLYLQALATTND